MLAVAGNPVFPPKSEKQQRTKGVRKPQIAFRVPQHLEGYIGEAESGGYTKTEVVLRMLETAKDVAEELGAEWFELERLARTEGENPGVTLAKLARAGLEARRKSRK